jgi:tetratricopeptide (TPR) repeat protein
VLTKILAFVKKRSRHNRVMTRHNPTVAAAVVLALLVIQPADARRSSIPQDPSTDLQRRAEEQMRDGREDEAIASARQAAAAAPSSYQANTTLGAMLDLAGKYSDARDAFAKAAQVAQSAEDKARAERAIAVSYGFERDCTNVAKHDEPVYRQYIAANDFNTAGGVANELARLCLDAGNIDVAERWYRTGSEAGLRDPAIKADGQALWQFRLEHALARIAARRGQKAEAGKHVAAAKEILDGGKLPDQQKEFFPYLTGYVALYTGDYQAALTALQQANQNDAYVLGLIAQTYEKLGQRDKAMEYYRKVMAATTHNPTTAGSRPLAREKLAAR